MASQITFGSLPSWPLGPQDNSESNPGATGASVASTATNRTSASVGTTEIFPQGPGTATPAGQTASLFRRVLTTPSTQSSLAPSNTGDPSLPPPLELPDLPTPTGAATTKRARKKRSSQRQGPAAAAQPTTSVTVPNQRSPTPEVDLTRFQGRHKRSKLSAETMEKVKQQSLDQLRRTVAKDPEYLRLTVSDKLQLDAAYRAYQAAVHRIAIENKLHIKPVLDYLGNEARIRGPSCYNNFCKYDPVAGAINRDKTISSKERASQCGALWRQLTREEQAHWKDQEYLDSFPAHNDVESTAPDVNNATESATLAPAPRTLPRDRFSLKRWAHKVQRELRNLSTAHQVEGYLVLASRDPVRPVLLTRGSHMAEEFLDILASDTNQCNSFFNFRRRGVDGDDPNCPYDLGSKKANAAEVCKLLREELSKATHGAWQNGWPGTKTAATLRKLGVTLSIQENDQHITAADFCKRPLDMFIGQTQRILLAFSKGWVKITGPPESNNPSIGRDSTLEDDTDSGSEPEATSTRSKRCPPRKTTLATKAAYRRVGIIRKPRSVRKRPNASVSSSSEEDDTPDRQKRAFSNESSTNDHFDEEDSSDKSDRPPRRRIRIQSSRESSAGTDPNTPPSPVESAIAALV
ncbi:hypothetical protein PGT21_007345 [Puccinia graminis f. sp. tritici]|uniref:Uncharacterized protein n=1 Tax=Puccinia graminis f. sp. tritici TaxID=56615 RepID=A0A5B0PAX1_PUCGR|nr:hypothetical protein PGT21_007345 [Puccinia graminis f. sp. tritici]KAA1134190.1 hypothetical protein PGTUg99_031688 [Puccinia graminis f. sp. tritici]